MAHESVTDPQKPSKKWPLGAFGGRGIPPYASAADLPPYDPQNLQKPFKNEAKWEFGGRGIPPYMTYDLDFYQSS